METNTSATGTATMDDNPTETEPMSTETGPNRAAQEQAAQDQAAQHQAAQDQPRWGPPPPPPPPRLSWLDVPIRRDSERMIGGVVAGVSKAYGFDRRTTRIAVAIGALVLPGIIALYIISMIMLPGRDEPPSTVRDILSKRRRRPLLILLAILAIGTGFGSWDWFGGIGWGFALVAVGVVLWLSPNFGSGDGPRAVATASGFGPPAPFPGATTEAPVVRRRRYPVQAVGLAAASVGALVAGIGDSADWWNVSTWGVVLGVLITLITTSVVGIIVNRSWFGIPMLLMFSAWTIGLVITHPNLDGGFGEQTFRPATVAEAEAEQRLGIGRLTLDLTDVPLGEQPLMIDAQVGYGQIRIIVPADAELRVESDVNAGHVVVNGDEVSDGVRRDDIITVPALDTEGPRHTIVLDVGVGAGEIKITQSG